ncbi:MAG: GAF domain-containing protein [Chloroflexi bacterium]|nr:GAF domain-containing protein [Ktedonobacteraceae bacterium]MBV9707998.1 GAF domain-containing protein [Chloroflexota bacterium]
MTQSADVEQELARHITRLRVCLQQVSGDSSGPEEGSDAWLLLDALIRNNDHALSSRFEQSGRWLAEQGGKLDVRLSGLQDYINALVDELTEIFQQQPSLLNEAVARLYRIQSESVLTLTRGYQATIEQVVMTRERRAQQLERRILALQRVNGVSNSTMDLDQMLEVTAQITAEELHVDLCSIFFYDELQRVLTLRATNGPRPLGGIHFMLRLGEGYSGWVADKGRPLLVQDALTHTNFAMEAHSYHSDYHGLMAVPIIFFGNAERLIGVISVQSCELRDFTVDEMNFVEVVAGIIAFNIENGRLYEQTDEQLRRKVHELATIHRVSSIIASTLNLDEVLQIITTQAVHLSSADRSCIFELDPKNQCLHLLAHHGMNSTMTHNMHLNVGHCCAGRAVQTGRASIAMDCFHADEHCILHDDPFISDEIHSVLCVPLQAKQKILGCICIYSSHRHMISPEQTQLVITFANEAAIAIENARLYEETRRGLELKSVLLRELHHRVKNNLATVAGILSLQRRRSKSPEVRHILAESVNRVQGLAATHDLLAHEDVSEARVDDIARKVVGIANANLRPPDKHITFVVESCEVVIPAQAVNILALVLNEMISNSIKHGMARQKEGLVIIRGREDGGLVTVQVIDTGNWSPTERASVEMSENGSFEGLGLSLIKHLLADIDGQFLLRREAASEDVLEHARKTMSTTPPAECTMAEVRFPLLRRSRA